MSKEKKEWDYTSLKKYGDDLVSLGSAVQKWGNTENLPSLNTFGSDMTSLGSAIVKWTDTPNSANDTPVAEAPKNTLAKSSILGVSDELYNTIFNSPYKTSEEAEDALADAKGALDNYNDVTNKNQIVSKSTKNILNTGFVVPSSVKQADKYLSQTLKKIQSGRTSYSDDVESMLDKIMNREKFSYDVDSDPLFQQALASSMNAGKTAMQDTIGQASALTGGYGSSYATTAANQAYNAFIEDAYDNLPQYYQMTLEAYNLEGEEMYRQFGAVSELDDKEYSRLLNAYDTTFQYRNQAYNEEYGRHRDDINDAFAMANLEISEHNQLSNDAYNKYMISSDYADKVYERDYNNWKDQVDIAIKQAGLEYDDYWANKNFENENAWKTKEFEANQSLIEYDKNLTERNSAKEDVWKLVDEGVSPGDALLEKAGLLDQADSIRKAAENKRIEKGLVSPIYGSTFAGGTQKGTPIYYASDLNTPIAYTTSSTDYTSNVADETKPADTSNTSAVSNNGDNKGSDSVAEETGNTNAGRYETVLATCLQIAKTEGKTAAKSALTEAKDEGAISEAEYIIILNKIG